VLQDVLGRSLDVGDTVTIHKKDVMCVTYVAKIEKIKGHSLFCSVVSVNPSAKHQFTPTEIQQSRICIEDASWATKVEIISPVA